jgi:DNA-directed RNA polymerase specialized sigma24 family protein
LVPELPDGVDQQEHARIRKLMRASVVLVWGGRGPYEVVAGRDPWDVVDEAWSSMAASGFRCDGPFPAHACAVARNKAIDALRRAELRLIGPSLDAPVKNEEGSQTFADLLEGSSASTEEEYIASQRLLLIEDAVFNQLETRERSIFLGVRVDGKSGAAVGRELIPPISGQRVGQILAEALIKIQRRLEKDRDMLDLGA